MKSFAKSLLFAAVVLTLNSFGRAEGGEAFWGKFSEKQDPKVIGTGIANELLSRAAPTKPMGYQETCTAYGSMRFANQIGDKDLLEKLIKRYEGMGKADGGLVNFKPGGVDASIHGSIPLEIYILTKKPEFLEVGKKVADWQFADPVPEGKTAYLKENSPKGLSWHTRFWIDDMFMLTCLQMQAYRASGEKIYLERATREMVAYLDKLQQPTGLFYHEPEVPFYWGRGDGWVAAGMTEVLQDLPKDDPSYSRIMDSYKKMMAALKENQDPAGYWHQLIDDKTSFAESSCTGMFTFAIANGVRNGWLDESYKETAKKGWAGLCTFVGDDFKVKEVCAGTNKKNDRQFYLDRPRLIGDFHGQAATVWAAWAMAR